MGAPSYPPSPAIPTLAGVEFCLLWAMLGTVAYCTYTDIRRRTIPNWCTYGLLVAGLVGQVFACGVARTEAATAVLTVLVALAVALSLYAEGVWAPGDAKLYWAVAVAFPPWLVRDRSVASLDGPVAAIAVNSFVAYFVVLLLWVAVARRCLRRVAAAQRPSLVAVLGAAPVAAASVGACAAVASVGLRTPLSVPVAAGAAVLVAGVFERIPHIGVRMAVVAPWVAAGLYLAVHSSGQRAYAATVATVWCVLVIRVLVRQQMVGVFARAVPVLELEPGLVPRVPVVGAGGAGQTGNRGRVVPGEHSAALCVPGRPLSRTQIRRLRDEVVRHLLPPDTLVEVEQDVPFAPFLLAGVLGTMFLGGSLVGPLPAWLN